MKLLEPGTALDGFLIEKCIHSGGMAHIYRVHYADVARSPGFPMAMKIPRMTAGDGGENIVSFEIESQLMQVLTGPHVPHLGAMGVSAAVEPSTCALCGIECSLVGRCPDLCPP